MDKQTLRYTFLLYFAGQYAKKEDMEYDTLLEMSDNNYDLCSEVVCDMVKEGLVSGIELIETKAGYAIGQYQGKLKLTSKGLKEIMGLFPEENKEIIDEIQKGNNFIDNKEDLLENFLKKEKNRISQLSNEDKNKEIIEKILSYFKFLNANIHNYPDGKIKSSEIKEKVKNILSIYYEKAPQIFAQKVTKEMLEDYGYITFLYKKISPDEYDIDKLLTSKGASYLEQLEKDYKEKFENYCKENNIKFPDPIGSNAKILKTIKNSPTQKAIESVQNFHKIFSNEQLTELIKKANIADRAAQSITNINPITLSPNVIDEVKKDKEGNETKDNKEKTYTFEGILGQNCGEVEKYIDSSKQLQARNFVISRGIKVLRGYAPASKLYEASKAEYDYYQRIPYKEHLDSLETFLLSMKDSAKYIPEITLVSRNPLNLKKFNLDVKALSPTNRGKIDNLNYYILQTSANELFRIDGNHRLEAAYYIYKKYNKDLCFPFSIILWNPEDYIGDGSKIWKDMIDEERKENEAFLFYFLNSKAKKLEIEENLKGIIKADKNRWRDSDLDIADKSLAIMRNFYVQTKHPSRFFLNENLCGENGLLQISQILSKIMETDKINQQEFDKVLKLTNSILEMDISENLKNFNFYCQLIFYIAYQNKTKEKCIEKIKNLDNWVKKYNFSNETFKDPILLYKNAKQTNNLDPINIFIAMPYYNDDAIDDFNDQFRILKNELENKYPELIGRFNIYEIMRHRGYAIDIQQQIIDQIKSANIFIADISECICQKGSKKVDSHANPNVMYELGIAKSQPYTEIILLKNKKDKIEVPSDIITKYHNKFEFGNKVAMRKKIFEAIENILKDKFEII